MSYKSQIREGMEVRSSDDKKVGKVLRCEADSFVIEKGLLFHKDYAAPYSLVKELRGDTIILAALEVDMKTGTYKPEQPLAGQGMAGAPIGAGAHVTEETRVPLVEEEIDVAKRTRRAGEVEVRKEVVTETKHIEVPVKREEVKVERVPADRPVSAGEARFQGETVRVPIEEEEIEIKKRPVVREEVRVTKERRQEQRTATAQTRKEVADIEETKGGKKIEDPNARKL